MRRTWNIKRKIYAGIVSLVILTGIAIPVSVSVDKSHHSNVESHVNMEYDSKNILQVHFIDVGQGDSILLSQGNEAMLIDAGENEMGSYVVGYCQSNGIEELKYAVGTHAHEDHIGGMDYVIKELDVENLILTQSNVTSMTYEEVIHASRSKNIPEIYPKAGETFSLGNAVIQVVAPNRQDYTEENNLSLILKVTYGEISYLLCGDAEIESEYDMVENGLDITADVIKIGHHGSDTSTSQMLLKTVQPQYAVISVGKDNPYGHPSDNILNRLTEYGISYFRTDKEGTIVSVTDGKNIAWSCESIDGIEDVDSEEITNIQDNTEECDYVVNIHTKKFHKPDCESVEDILEKNREYYLGNRDTLIKEGYAPCKRCCP